MVDAHIRSSEVIESWPHCNFCYAANNRMFPYYSISTTRDIIVQHIAMMNWTWKNDRGHGVLFVFTHLNFEPIKQICIYSESFTMNGQNLCQIVKYFWVFTISIVAWWNVLECEIDNQKYVNDQEIKTFITAAWNCALPRCEANDWRICKKSDSGHSYLICGQNSTTMSIWKKNDGKVAIFAFKTSGINFLLKRGVFFDGYVAR